MALDADHDGRVIKKPRLSNGTTDTNRTSGASRIFAPYRTIGLVSPTSVPFTAVALGKTTFQITTSVGRSLQTYDLRRGLNLVFITRPQTPEIITASIAWKDKVFAAWGGSKPSSERGVWVFKRGKQVGSLEVPPTFSENVQSFCIFGPWIVGVCPTTALVWKAEAYDLYTSLRGISPIPFTTSVASLPTFLNKIVIGRQDGSAEIWNVASAKLIYTILPPSTACGAVTAIEPTPALSLIAIAYENGRLLIHDIRADHTVISLSGPPGVPVTSISFRTDGLGAGDDGRIPGVLATASTASGDVTFWDLNNGGGKTGTLRAAHSHATASTAGGISKIEFLAGQAILVSSGLDNSLKTWIFDDTPFSPVPRILHARSGHGAPITKLHFLPSQSDGSDDSGKWLMSGSDDRSLWGWSLRRDGQSAELSQGGIQKKAKKQGLLAEGNRDKFESLKCPPITAIACSLNRDGGIGALPGKQPIWKGAKGKQASAEISAMTGWESIVTAHKDDNKARTWFWGRKRAGRWTFETGDSGSVTAIAVSVCGTFAIVGSEKGGMDSFNLQSGIHRQRFPARLTSLQAKQLRLDVTKHRLVEEKEGKHTFLRGQGKHSGSIVGIAIDNLNKIMISASTDGKIKFWDFRTGTLSGELDWSISTRIHGMRFHGSSDLAAFACSDGCVRVVDTTTRRLIRELWIQRPSLPMLATPVVNDFIFSHDGHWIAACTGSVVLLWDLPTGHLIDAFKLNAECKSLALSPTGEFLATATRDNVGVDVWSNRALYSHVPTRHLNDGELAKILSRNATAPTASGEGGRNLVDEHDELEDDGVEVELIDDTSDVDLDQLSSDLVSLSMIPRSRWQNLLHLDLIRQRNRPIEPPKKPQKVPFFLPSLQDKQAAPDALDSLQPSQDHVEKEKSRISRLVGDGTKSTFTALLQEAERTNDYVPFLGHLKTLNPAAADVEMRSMSAERDEMASFVRSLTWLLQQRRDFELGQAWMAVFLRIHSDVVASDDRLRDAVEQWSMVIREEKNRVQRLTDYCNGLVGFLRAARV